VGSYRPEDRAANFWVIAGCGYTGERLASRLRTQGARVIATSRRSERIEELRARGIDARPWDRSLVDGAIVVDSTPPGIAPTELTGVRRIVYLSSTGVYALGDGSWVDEDTPTAPSGPRGEARLAHERALAAAEIDHVILRVAAIYGPGRGVAERLRSGQYRVVGDGSNWVSRIHVDDLVTVIIAAGSIATPPRRTYVVADDEPITSRAYADAVAARLGLPSAPSIPVETIRPETADLVLTNRRIRNARMKAELGVTLAYPTWRDALV
jgi:nucleoside-diphosphate-sugar epimerase